MKKSNLLCPNCESQLDRQTCERISPDYKLLECPCCNFFIQNSTKLCASWRELEAIAVEMGATRR
jgi:hypothetical protein